MWSSMKKTTPCGVQRQAQQRDTREVKHASALAWRKQPKPPHNRIQHLVFNQDSLFEQASQGFQILWSKGH